MNRGSRGWESAGQASTFTDATSTADPCGSLLLIASSRPIRSTPIPLLSSPPPQTPSPQTRPHRPLLLQFLNVSGPTTGRGEPLKQLLSLPRLSAPSSYDRLQAAGQCCRLFANVPPPAPHAIASPPRFSHMVIVHSVNNGLLEPSLHSAYFRLHPVQMGWVSGVWRHLSDTTILRLLDWDFLCLSPYNAISPSNKCLQRSAVFVSPSVYSFTLWATFFQARSGDARAPPRARACERTRPMTRATH